MTQYMVINPDDDTFVGFFTEKRMDKHGLFGAIIEITPEQFKSINSEQYDRYNIETETFYTMTVELEKRIEEVINIRRSKYTRQSDHLFMEWQYDQSVASEIKWRDKVAEIKRNHPIPTE